MAMACAPSSEFFLLCLLCIRERCSYAECASSLPDGAPCDLPGCVEHGAGTCFSKQCLGICPAATGEATTLKPTTGLVPTEPASPALTTSRVTTIPTTAPISIPVVGASCGDGVCNAFEDCSSCPSDCPHGTSALGAGFCCAAWGCDGRGCPPLALSRSTCHLGSDVRLCKVRNTHTHTHTHTRVCLFLLWALVCC